MTLIWCLYVFTEVLGICKFLYCVSLYDYIINMSGSMLTELIT